MKSIKYTVVLLLSIVSINSAAQTIKPSLISHLPYFTRTERTKLYIAGAALVGYNLLYNVIDPVCSYIYYAHDGSAQLLESPDIYKKQPDSIAELQEMLQAAVQEDYALMMKNRENPFIKGGLDAMGKTQLRNHSRVGAITLATATKDKKTKSISISWASIPGLSEEQIQQLNQLQYRYTREFYNAIRPDKRTYEVNTFTTNAFGKKYGFYYHAPTMKQKRLVQQTHMQRALSCVEAMWSILAPAQGSATTNPPQSAK